MQLQKLDQTELAESYLSSAMRILWGDRLDTEGMAETPKRVLKHWKAITKGLEQDPGQHLEKTFPCDHQEVVIIRDIPFNSLCEHHLLPFYGTADVAYLPKGRVVGLSKIPRALDVIAARPQMQERITHDLSEVIWKKLNPAGVLVRVTAAHTCMSTRGALKPGSQTTTLATRGIYWTDAIARREVLSMLTGH